MSKVRLIVSNFTSLKIKPARISFTGNTYKQRQAEIDKKLSKRSATPWATTFHYLKIIRLFHPRYHPKIIRDIPKNVQKTSDSFLMTFMINSNENEAGNEK